MATGAQEASVAHLVGVEINQAYREFLIPPEVIQNEEEEALFSTVSFADRLAALGVPRIMIGMSVIVFSQLPLLGELDVRRWNQLMELVHPYFMIPYDLCEDPVYWSRGFTVQELQEHLYGRNPSKCWLLV
jgi:hypothetical protein